MRLQPIEREFVLNSDFYLSAQRAPDRLQTRPKQTVMHDQKIDLSSGGCRQNSRRDIYSGTDFGDVARVFDLQAVERVWPIFDLANAQILVRVFDNLRKRRHWQRPYILRQRGE